MDRACRRLPDAPGTVWRCGDPALKEVEAALTGGRGMVQAWARAKSLPPAAAWAAGMREALRRSRRHGGDWEEPMLVAALPADYTTETQPAGWQWMAPWRPDAPWRPTTDGHGLFGFGTGAAWGSPAAVLLVEGVSDYVVARMLLPAVTEHLRREDGRAGPMAAVGCLGASTAERLACWVARRWPGLRGCEPMPLLVLLDGDAVGRRAARRAAQAASGAGGANAVAVLPPDGTDLRDVVADEGTARVANRLAGLARQATHGGMAAGEAVALLD